MPLDSRVKRFLDALAAGKPPGTLDPTVQERRLGLAALMKFAGPAPAVDRVEDRRLPGPGGPLPVRIYTPSVTPAGVPSVIPAGVPSVTPAGARSGASSGTLSGTKETTLAGLVYFHGGGLVAGTVETHDCIARALANAGACCVVSVEYRLAPEHPFPAALEDALAAMTHIGAHAAEFGIDEARLGICGDSAGATLAAATCHEIARLGTPRLALQLLICPILDYSRTTPSRRDLASGYLIDQATLDHDLKYYAAPGTDPANPRISPLRCLDVAGLPRTLIHTAEYDPLRDEGRDYFERLARADSEVSYTCHPGMIHLFYGLGAVIPYARTAYERIGGEIRAAFA